MVSHVSVPMTLPSFQERQYEGARSACTPIIYTAGQSFTDIGCGDVHLIRNEGNVNAVTVVVQIIPAGEPRRIDADAPGNCPLISCP